MNMTQNPKTDLTDGLYGQVNEQQISLLFSINNLSLNQTQQKKKKNGFCIFYILVFHLILYISMLTWIIIALKVWSDWKNVLCIERSVVHCAVWSTALTGAKQAAFFRSAWQIHMSEIYTGASSETLNRMESYQKTLEVQALTVLLGSTSLSRSLFRARRVRCCLCLQSTDASFYFWQTAQLLQSLFCLSDWNEMAHL